MLDHVDILKDINNTSLQTGSSAASLSLYHFRKQESYRLLHLRDISVKEVDINILLDLVALWRNGR